MDVSYELYPGEPDDAQLAEVALVSDVVFGEDHREVAVRLTGRPHVLVQLARVGDRPVAYKIGYAEREGRFHSWLGGVLPEYRRRGIARELMQRQQAWALKQGYHTITMATMNRWRGMLLLSIREGFDVYGTRLNSKDRQLILLRKSLQSAQS